MAKRREQNKLTPGRSTREPPMVESGGEQRLYQDASRLAVQGQYAEARRRYDQLSTTVADDRLRALVHNDLAVLDAVQDELSAALTGFEAALAVDDSCEPARLNLALLQSPESTDNQRPQPPANAGPSLELAERSESCKVAIVSFLFNWPSTGGGVVHTVELARFLARAGYEVKHFFARHLPWGIGNVEQQLPITSEALDFSDSNWSIAGIQDSYRHAVGKFNPDYVIITDCWNFKPHLAEALCDYPCFLRQQAMECLCPLNNLRLQVDGHGQVHQCPRHQLATPEACAECLRARGTQAGNLHRVERALSEVETVEYQAKLRRAFQEAEGVLVLNPLTAEMIRPYAKSVHVVTWGMDPARFPWPWPEENEQQSSGSVTRILMAGLVPELIKGFHVLHEACGRLWERRRDFELLATGEPAGRVDEFTRFVGWLPQEELPKCIRQADMLVMPTIAQEGLGRTTVEAMAVGRPVIASRIGGLPYTVRDGLTGLLCEPGNAADLAEKLEILLENPELRQQMGMAGRRVFESEFTWDTVIERSYRPLLVPRRQLAAV